MATPAPTPAAPNKNISTLKRTRIDIWRTEVAALSPSASAATPTIASSSARDTTSPTPSRSNSCASSASTYSFNAANGAVLDHAAYVATQNAHNTTNNTASKSKSKNRVKAFWRRLLRRLSIKSSRTAANKRTTPPRDPNAHLIGYGYGEGWMLPQKPSNDVWDRDVRTEMWQVTAENLPQRTNIDVDAAEAAAAAADVEAAAFDRGDGSDDGARNGGALKKKQERLERAARLLQYGVNPNMPLA